jgi:hypothetical protein
LQALPQPRICRKPMTARRRSAPWILTSSAAGCRTKLRTPS